MGQRLELHTVLVDILGSAFVYFQPPANVQMKYPCIVYKRDNSSTEFAGNYPYSTTKSYTVMCIDRNPDTEIPDKVEGLPMCRFDRHYVANDLNHYVFTVFF